MVHAKKGLEDNTQKRKAKPMEIKKKKKDLKLFFKHRNSSDTAAQNTLTEHQTLN